MAKTDRRSPTGLLVRCSARVRCRFVVPVLGVGLGLYAFMIISHIKLYHS